MPPRLSQEQIDAYHANGYLIGLPPVFTPDEVAKMSRDFQTLTSLLRPGERIRDIREWHEASRWLYDLCTHPVILDYVEELLGPNFYLWASNFFAKAPHSPETVGWHQDAYYWPLSPHNSITVWIAFTDVDEENGAMQVVPGTHRAGLMRHQHRTRTDSVLNLVLDEGTFSAADAVSLKLKAGEVSFHDDALVHGSPANPSDRWRIGLTARYSGTSVKCDLSVNPHFKTYLLRGVDKYQHNPAGQVPTQKFGRLEREHRSHDEVETYKE